jgi:CYTH domain-containing protein
MEIEKKFLVTKMPEIKESLGTSVIEQGYLSSEPVIRIRRLDEQYILTYKSRENVEKQDGVCINREEEFPLTKAAYEHLKPKCDGHMIQKERQRIPYEGYTIELDIFHGKYEGMMVAEVEFATVEEAEKFSKPDWFGKNVSDDYHYSNAFLATGNKTAQM